jgi:hypothetical protein
MLAHRVGGAREGFSLEDFQFFSLHKVAKALLQDLSHTMEWSE